MPLWGTKLRINNFPLMKVGGDDRFGLFQLCVPPIIKVSSLLLVLKKYASSCHLSSLRLLVWGHDIIPKLHVSVGEPHG